MTYYHNSLTMNIIIHYKLKKKEKITNDEKVRWVH